jgi:hypothetical protein
MKKFSSISEFRSMNEKEISKVRGGLNEPTRRTTTVISQTAHCTCDNNVPDNCTDTGQGSVCVNDPE